MADDWKVVMIDDLAIMPFGLYQAMSALGVKPNDNTLVTLKPCVLTKDVCPYCHANFMKARVS